MGVDPRITDCGSLLRKLSEPGAIKQAGQAAQVRIAYEHPRGGDHAASDRFAGRRCLHERQRSFDVVVVGGGGAGLAAAAEAARLGRSVVLLEKNPKLGGSTAWSVGSMSITNSPHQQRARHTGHAAGALRGPRAARRPATRRATTCKLRRILVENTTDMFEWLTRPRPRVRGADAGAAAPRNRMHLVLPNSRAFPYYLGRHCRRLGVDIRARNARRAADRRERARDGRARRERAPAQRRVSRARRRRARRGRLQRRRAS